MLALDKVNSNEMTGSFITALNTDHKGYLWVGTSNGLNRYDGYNFLAFRSYKADSTSLSHPTIRVIKQFSDPELFIGTSNGLNIYSFEKNNFCRVSIDTTLPNFKKKNSITSLLQLKDNRIVVGTQSGLMLFDDKETKLKNFDSDKKTFLDGYVIQSMCTDKNGDLWLGTKIYMPDGGLRFRVFKYTFADKKLKELIISEYGSSGHIGISVDYTGTIWLSIDDGLMSIHPKTFEQKFYKAPNEFLSSVSYFHSKDNYIYQGYWSFGVTIFDIDKKEFKIIKNDPDNNRTLISNKVWSLFKDDNGVVWYGTDVGLQKQSNKRPNLEIIKRNAEFAQNTFTSNQMLAVWHSRKHKNKLIVGIDGNGFAVYDKLTHKTENHVFGNRNLNKVEERFISQFFESEDGSIYAAGQYNFMKITIGDGPTQIKHFFYQQQHHFTSVFQDHTDKNILWIGSIGQIIKFNMQTEQSEFIIKPGGSSNIFFNGISNRSGTYFTSQNSILKINTDQTPKLISVPDAGNITSIEGFDDEHLLLGTSFLGLIKYNVKKNTYELIKNNTNSFFAEIRCIKKIRNTFWIGTLDGLFQYYPFSKEVLEYNLIDGLPSNVIQNIDYFEGYLYLATTNGLVILNPNILTTHFTIPKVDITSLIGIGNDLEIISDLNGKEIEIPQSKNSFKINFTVLDFNLPEKNSYRYKLLPVQKEFKNNNHEHSVSFNELNVGEYTFQVIGSNSDNTWNTEPVFIKIRVVPPFYNSKVFYFLLGFVALLIAGGIFYIRFRRIKNNQVYLEKTISERTEEIRLKQKQLEKSNSELVDSITYAQKIQKAFLVGEKILNDTLPDSFIYFKPKEKVSGDFFWIGREDGYLIIAAGDCTGHGVPGAMLSVIGTTLLNKIVHEQKVLMPGGILTELNYLFYHQLNVDEKSLRDGMDISIFTINLHDKRMFFCGARNNGTMIESGVHNEFMAQRETIGENETVTFETKEIQFNQNATYYLYSDGYKDQFGGPNSKKLASKAFKDILVKGSKLMINGQANYFGRFIKDWQGAHSQTDDRMIIGFKLHYNPALIK